MEASYLSMLHDPGRLAALRKLALVDTPADAGFDRLGRLAAEHLGVPIALVTLVEEDRQFFKSCLGLPEPWKTWRQSPLSHSFCQHLLASNQPLVINNARTHPMFKDNPAIKDFGVAAYLGIPLVTSHHYVLGSFCVIDAVPRVWTTKDISIAQDFASLVMDAIELRETKRELEQHIEAGSTSFYEQAHQLKAAEERFRLVAKATNDCVWDWDLKSNSVWWNEGITTMFGYQGPAIGHTATFWYDHIYPEDRERVVAGIHADIEAKTDSWSDEYRFMRADGTVAEVFDRGFIVFNNGGEAVRMVGAMMDITERKRIHDALKKSEERYRLLFERNLAGVYRAALDGTILDCNDSLARILGYESREEVLQNSSQYFYSTHSESAGFIADLQTHGQLANYEVTLRRKDGNTARILENVSLVMIDGKAQIEGTVIDITSYKQLEEQFWQSQKMEGIGRLAGGIAHDFNNLLSVITGYTELMVILLGPSSPLQHNVANILRAARRAATLIRQLLAFSRKQIFVPRVLDINVVVSEIVDMLPHLIGEDIEIVFAPQSHVSHIGSDPAQIEQVIMNLAVNARDAMPYGGKLTLETANVTLDNEYAKTRPSVIPGEYVMLSISDTGSGMSDETKKHLFEPFYTTKEPGKGTGLGLSTIYGIVKHSGGNICVDSELGRGTTFKIHFPSVDQPLSRPEQAGSSGSPGGTETVLLVEDEESLLKLTRHFLTSKGYQVLVASNGIEAIEIAKRPTPQIDILLTDIIMPGMNGHELADRLKNIKPGIKVLFTSGYTDREIIHNDTLEHGAKLVQKPFTLDELARAVRDSLDEK